MKISFSDYSGPTGLYVATGSGIVPLASKEGALAFAASGLQAGTISPAQGQAIEEAA